jgi:hypothetical protein
MIFQHTLKKLTGPIFFSLALLMLLLFSNICHGCGSVEMAVQGYWGKNNFFESPEECLQALIDPDCVLQSTYQGKKSEIDMLNIIIDIFNNRPWLKDLGRQIFQRWNHLFGARDHAGYKILKKKFGVGKPTKYRNWMLIKARNGAFLRETPSGDKLTVLNNFSLVKKLAQPNKDPEWIKVKIEIPTNAKTPLCRYQSPCHTGFVHTSLLEDY